MIKKLTIFGLITMLGACSSAPTKIVIDQSREKGDWVDSSQITWSDGDFVLFRTSHTIRGDERVNGCYDLASLDAREQLLKGIADEVKGSIDHAQQDISENAEVLLGKVRSGKFEGRIIGLKDQERYFERYQIRDEANKEKVERIDCFLLSKISKADFAQTKRNVVNKVVAIDPELRKAVTKKQIDFFSTDRKPSSDE